MRRRVKDHPIDSMNNPERIVLVAGDLQRQQLGVDAGPEGTLVLLALTHPLCHPSDTADVLGDLRDHFLGAGGELVGYALLRFLKALERADMLELAVLPVTGAGCEPSTTLITISNYDKHQLGGSERKQAGPTSKHFDRNHEPPSEPTSDCRN